MNKKRIMLHLRIVLISVLLGSVFALPVYLDWQNNRDYIKAKFNIFNENDMNKTQALGLKLIDNWGSGKVLIVFSMVAGLAFTIIEGLCYYPKPLEGR